MREVSLSLFTKIFSTGDGFPNKSQDHKSGQNGHESFQLR